MLIGFGGIVGAGLGYGKKPAKAAATRVIDTSNTCRSIRGFRGPVPLRIHVSGNVITKIEALPNQETPAYFKKVTDSGLLKKWNGKTLKQAATMKVDAVSGATYSSRAVIRTVQKAVRQ